MQTNQMSETMPMHGPDALDVRPLTAAEMVIEPPVVQGMLIRTMSHGAMERPATVATTMPVLASPIRDRVGLPQHLGSVANGQPNPHSEPHPHPPHRHPADSHVVSPGSGQQLTLSGKVVLGLGWDPVEGDQVSHLV